MLQMLYLYIIIYDKKKYLQEKKIKRIIILKPYIGRPVVRLFHVSRFIEIF